MKKRKGTGSWGIPSLFVCRRIPGKGGKDVKCPGRKRSRGRPDTGGHPESRPVMGGKGKNGHPNAVFCGHSAKDPLEGGRRAPKGDNFPVLFCFLPLQPWAFGRERPPETISPGHFVSCGKTPERRQGPCVSRDLARSSGPARIGRGQGGSRGRLPSREGHEGKGRRAGDGQGEAFQKGIPDSGEGNGRVKL